MAKIPIDFSLGMYADPNLRLGNRAVSNCYPETTSGAVNKSIVRAVEGYTVGNDDSLLNFNCAIFARGAIYAVEGQSLVRYAGTLFIRVVLTSSMGLSFETSNVVMATNGKTIVIVNPNGSTDYYWDIDAGTGASMSTLTNWNGFGVGGALDVAVQDGYYVFINRNIIWHGSNVSTTNGLTFNSLSFTPLPANAEDGIGLAVANSQLYVFAKNKTYLYQTAPTTPFSFALSQGFDMELGLSTAAAKVSFDDRILIYGKEVGSRSAVFLIEGSSYQEVSNQFIAESIGEPWATRFSAFKVRGHRMVMIAPSKFPSTSGGRPSESFVIDLTETSVKGVPVWHQREMDSLGRFPIIQYVDNSQIISRVDSPQIAVGIRDSLTDYYTTIYEMDYEGSLADSEFFGDSPNEETVFEYSFTYIRNQGDSLPLKKCRLRFTDNVRSAELFVFTGDAYASLGSFDLSSVDSKTAEWRRLGRYNEDVQFKVQFKPDYKTESTPSSGSKPVSLIEGYFET